MIIKGCARGAPIALARHVKKAENETVRVVRTELKAKDPSLHHRLYNPFLHMSVEGNEFVARQILPVLGER